MNDLAHPRKHLHSDAEIARAKDHPPRERLRKPRRAGNGLRANGVYFLVVSLAALIGFMVVIVLVSARTS